MTLLENNNNNLDDTHINRCDYGSLKDLPTAFLSLLKNKTFMSISIGAALDAFILAGLSFQFNIRMLRIPYYWFFGW